MTDINSAFQIPDLALLQALEEALKSPVRDFRIVAYKELWDNEYGKMGDNQIPVSSTPWKMASKESWPSL